MNLLLRCLCLNSCGGGDRVDVLQMLMHPSLRTLITHSAVENRAGGGRSFGEICCVVQRSQGPRVIPAMNTVQQLSSLAAGARDRARLSAAIASLCCR